MQLSADPSRFVAGLNIAGRAVNRLAGMASSITRATSAGGAGGFLGSAISSVTNLAQTAAAAVPKIGPLLAESVGLAGGAVQTALGFFEQGVERINAMRNAAIQLGVPMKDMGGLALVFGGDMEAASRGLLHMRKTIMDAVQTGKGAAGVFNTLGVTAEELSAMGGKQQIDVVVESIRKLGDATQVAAATFDLFGERRGANFLTMISRGKAGLDAAADAAARFGHNIDDVDANQVFLASRAMKQIDMAMTGIKMNIAVALAPIVSEFAAQFEQIGLNAQFVQAAATNMAKALGYGAAYAIDAWSQVKGVFISLKAIFQMFVGSSLAGIRAMLDSLAELPGFLGGNKAKEAAAAVGEEAMRWMRASVESVREMNRLAAAPTAVERVKGFFAGVAENVARAKAAAAAVVPPVPAMPQGPAEVKLAGAAGFGSQEAYKTLGEFAAGGQTSTLQKMLDQQKRLAELMQRGDVTLDDIKKQLKRGLVREG